MRRQANNTTLLGQGACDALSDPPRGVRAELAATAVVELFHGLHQAQVTFLDQVQEWYPLAHVALGDTHHQPCVGLDQVRACSVADINIADIPFPKHRTLAIPFQPAVGRLTALQLLRQADLLLWLQKRHARHFFEVQADGIITADAAEVEYLLFWLWLCFDLLGLGTLLFLFFFDLFGDDLDTFVVEVHQEILQLRQVLLRLGKVL